MPSVPSQFQCDSGLFLSWRMVPGYLSGSFYLRCQLQLRVHIHRSSWHLSKRILCRWFSRVLISNCTWPLDAMQASGLLVLGTYFGMYHVCVTWQVDLSLNIGQCPPMVFPITSLCAAHYRFCRHYPIVVPSKRCLETQSYYLGTCRMLTDAWSPKSWSITVRPFDGSYQDQPTLQTRRMQPCWLSNHLLWIIYGIQDRIWMLTNWVHVWKFDSCFFPNGSFPTLRHSRNAYAYLPSVQGRRTQGIEFRSSMGKERTESRLSQDRHRARERTMDRTYCVTLEGALFIFYFCFDIALRSL